MTRPESVAAAEKALEGLYESQDSQEVYQQYVTVYGIGVTSSSPPRPESTSSRQSHRGTKRRCLSRSIVHSDPPSRTASQPIARSLPSSAPPATDTTSSGNSGNALPQQHSNHHSRSGALPAPVAATATALSGQDRGPEPHTTSASAPSAPTELSDAANFPKSPLAPVPDGDAIDPPPDTIPVPCLDPETSGSLEKVSVPPRPSRSLPPKKAKMDMSDQSPTQDNDDRDYENYCEQPSFVPTSPIPQDAAAENHTIPDDDSGDVQFGSLSHLVQKDTQVDDEPSSVPEDTGLVMSRGAWRRRASSSQQQSSVQRADAQSPMLPAPTEPQTPAQQNPFAGMKKLGDPALVGSQLFGQTQFSSAVKRFSPTSSRPSPHVYAHNSISPNIAETSPLKNRCNITSPLISSSPQIILVEPTEPNHRERSPSNSGPPEDGTVPESPQYVSTSTRARPDPIDTYENMEESQKRRQSAEAEGNTSGEESDDITRAMRRKKLAASKQEAAAKDLSSIRVTRRHAREPVEIPPTTKKSTKPQARRSRYRTRHAGDESTASEDGDEFTVADSQGQVAVPGSNPRPSPDLGASRTGTKPGLVSSNDAVPDSTGATQKSVPNGVIPGTESSGDSARQKDIIPETSPNNTQSHFGPRIRASSDEPLVVPAARALQDSSAPANEAKEVDGDSAPTPETQPSLPQPSRRSTRQSRPTLKAQAQSLKTAAHTTLSSEPAGTDEPGPTNKKAGSMEDTAINEQPSVPEAVVQADRSAPSDVCVEDEPPLPSSPPVPKSLAKSRKLSGLASQKKGAESNPATPNAHSSPTAPEPPGSTSTLSVLTTTPVPSSKGFAASQESVELPPLSPDKPARGRPTTRSLPRLATVSRVAKVGTRRQVRRTTRLDSASTDELTRSPSVKGFENSIIQIPRNTARGSRLSMLSHTSRESSGAKIFAGMAFAISFQSKKDGEKPDQYEQRLGQSSDIEKMIVHAGGHLLGNGFDELFESNALKSNATSPVSEHKDDNPLTLTPWAQSLGFTALIADGHSRKVKYMQALALGLPCISDRWVATCVAKGAVVDWLPYLLCAGQSTFLRDAIRSRYLAPYPATDARLVDVVERRPKMLEGSQILLVMKKSRAEDKKMPYVFLAHVLGATLSRAYSLDEARQTLRQRELLNDPFDWVYVDEHTGTEDGLFSSAVPASKPSKKRKRAAAPAADDTVPPSKKIRTLSNELVIQSLILGRMIEEGELEA